ncbi:hypothetical protein SpCBS45565_g07448 [Spizellomyces sp. 'palustris']|nr:hypothetical protein SpCBS45565_g07448 [Spizellomyces sp. 'palustris']
MDSSDDSSNADEQAQSLLGRSAPRRRTFCPHVLTQPRHRIWGSIAALLIAVPVVAALYLTFFGIAGTLTSELPCNTHDCVITAGRILQNMNFSVDPCEDFYEFSCGGWIQEHPIPDDKSQVGTFDTLVEKNLRILKDAFESPYAPDSTLPPEEEKVNHQNFDKVQHLYLSCINETQIEGEGKEPIVAALKKVVKDFPLGIDNKLDAHKTILAVAAAHDANAGALFGMAVGQDDKDPDHNMILLEQSGLSLPSKEYYDDAQFIRTLTDAIAKSFSVILPDVNPDNTTDWERLAKGVVNVESELAKISLPSSELTDPSKLYNAYTIPTLKAKSPFIPWDSYLLARFPPGQFSDVINDSTKLIVTVPTFFGNLSSTLSNTSPQDMQNYILWHYIYNYADHSAKSLKDLLNELKEKTGQKAKLEPPRWRTCLGRTDAFLGEVAGRWFVARVFGGDSKKAASSTVEYIKQAFLERLPRIDWLDKITLERAIEKVNSLIKKIGYADIIMQPKALAEKYQDAAVYPDKYFENILSLTKWHIHENLKDIMKPVDRAKWQMTPATVNAYYNPTMNEIVFPAGILQPPFYSIKDPQYLNYGAIGMVVGHELTHAFDNMGRQYDSHGRLVDWWTNATQREFSKRAGCFIEQYSQYTVLDPDGKPQPIDGTLTLGENLADNGGVTRALEAWRMDMEAPGGAQRNPMLPGFDGFSKEQIFYISFAQVWCGNTRPELALRRLRTDPHSPNKYRVIGALVNSMEFAQVYSCPVGSAMNPEKKCLIW